MSIVGGSHPRGEMLSAYVDSELVGAERLAVDRHVRECATCRATVETFRAQRDLFQRVPAHRVPMSLRRDLYRRIEAHERRRSAWPLPAWPGWLPRPSGNVLALTVTIVLLLVMAPHAVAVWNTVALPGERASQPVTEPLAPAEVPLAEPEATPVVPTPVPPTSTAPTLPASPTVISRAAPVAPAITATTAAGAPRGGDAASPSAGPASQAAATSTERRPEVTPTSPPTAAPTPSVTAPAGPRLITGIVGRITEVDRRRNLIVLTTAESPSRTWHVTIHEGTLITLADGGRRLRPEDLGIADQVEVSGFEAQPGATTLMAATARVLVSAVPQSPVAVRTNRVLVLLDGVESLRAPQFGFTGDWVKRLNDTGYAVTAVEPARISSGNVDLKEFGLIVIGYPATLSDAALRTVVQSKVPVLNADPRLVQPLGMGLNLDPQQPTRNVAGKTVDVAGQASPITRGLGGETVVANDNLYRMPIITNGTTLGTIGDGGRRQVVWSQTGHLIYFGFWWSSDGQNHNAVYWALFDRSVLALLGRDPSTVPVPTAAPRPTATPAR